MAERVIIKFDNNGEFNPLFSAGVKAESDAQAEVEAWKMIDGMVRQRRLEIERAIKEKRRPPESLSYINYKIVDRDEIPTHRWSPPTCPEPEVIVQKIEFAEAAG